MADIKIKREVSFMSAKKDSEIKSIVVTAFFAAVIFLGIQIFRVPLPAAVGTRFHFGHIFVVLAILLLGTKRSMIAGVIGLILFDIINGYTHAIPNVLFSTIVKCLIVGIIYGQMTKNKKNKYGYAIIAIVILWYCQCCDGFCMVCGGACDYGKHSAGGDCGRAYGNSGDSD